MSPPRQRGSSQRGSSQRGRQRSSSARARPVNSRGAAATAAPAPGGGTGVRCSAIYARSRHSASGTAARGRDSGAAAAAAAAAADNSVMAATRARARSKSATLLGDDAAEAPAAPLDPPAPVAAAGGVHAAAVAACVAVIVGSWVAMSLLLQGLQDGWQKPWFILYTIHSGYAVNLLPFAALHLHRRAAAPPGVAPPVPLLSLFQHAGALQLLAAFVGYSWYLSLPSTLASANNAIYQSASLVVYLLSIPLLGEAVTAPKLAATAVSVVGVCLVSFAGSSDSAGSAPVHQTPGGYAWVLVSVVAYALYEIAYALMMGAGHGHGHGGGGGGARCWRLLPRACRRRRHAHSGDHQHDDAGSEDDELLAHDDASGTSDAEVAAAPSSSTADAATVPPHWQLLVRAETSAFVVGAMGVWSLLTLWPVFFALHYAGVESFELPPPGKARLLAVNVGLDAAYNLALLLGIVVTSPLYMSLGSMLVVPATVAADWAVHGSVLGGQAGGGVALILVGFLLLQAPADVGARLAAWLTGRPRPQQPAAKPTTAAISGAGAAVVEPGR